MTLMNELRYRALCPTTRGSRALFFAIQELLDYSKSQGASNDVVAQIAYALASVRARYQSADRVENE